LTLPAAPDSVAVVRHALGGITAPLGMGAAAAELRLAVTEACTNVVRHAYRGGHTGPLEIHVHASAQELWVDVRDRGPGIRPRTRTDSLGLGLSLIASLSDGLRIFRDAEGWSVLAMCFRRPAEVPA
jgi:anti-sigma regulatory factor (Ser/Thr protein kinase)